MVPQQTSKPRLATVITGHCSHVQPQWAASDVCPTGLQQTNSADHAFGRWRAYHLFYHSDHDRMLRLLVRPLLIDLFRMDLIRRFFFVRYTVGGPHLRLRWQLADDSPRAEAMFIDASAKFFSRNPSLSSWSEDAIHRENQRMLRSDPFTGPQHDVAYSDNSWARFPLHFEFDRYGGEALLGYSLDMFCLSSVHVLSLLTRHDAISVSWKRLAMFRLTLDLAWGLAENEENFVDLASYAVRWMGEQYSDSCRHGTIAFENRAAQLVDVVRGDVESKVLPERAGVIDDLSRPASWLAQQTADLLYETRRYLAESHIHMTINRLGLNNAEEVYLSCILRRSIEAFRTSMPELWRKIWELRSDFVTRARAYSLEQVVTSALERLAL